MKNFREQFFEKAPLIFTVNKVILDSAGMPVDYKLLDVNPAFETLLNIRKHRALGESITKWLLTSKKTRKKWLVSFNDLVLTEGTRCYDETLQMNGHQYVVTAFVSGQSHLIILLHKAVRFEKTHRDLQEIQSIFDNTPSSIIIYQVKGKGESSFDYIIRSVNPASLKTENWKKEHVTGKALGELRPGADEFGIVDIFREVWKTGQPAYYPANIYKEGGERHWYENTVFKLPTGEIVAVYDDVTEKKEAEEELLREKERLKVTLYSIGDGVITTDKDGRVDLINPVAENLSGWTQNDAKGRPLSDVFDIYSEISGEPCENPVDTVLKRGKAGGVTKSAILKSKDGRERIIADSVASIKNRNGDILGAVLVFRDVTEEREKEAQIEYLSYRDSLTGLYNRAYFEEVLKKLDSERRDNYPLTLIMGDLDGLKLINDVFGHQTGDEALVKVADVIRTCCREKDVISRWGGDEIVILLQNTTEEAGQNIGKRIKEGCSRIKVSDTSLSISLGCAAKVDSNEKWEDVLKRAEDNMYKSKLLGAKSYRSIVLASIKNTLSEKSCETEEHGERLGRFCRGIGKSMGLTSYAIDELEVLAVLHDIGKIGIDDQILEKPGALTGDEFQVIKKHPEIGYRIAQTVPELLTIADYILAHHERWDGKGYPRGLAGDEIPLSARILAVVDAYDAITQDRPYRKALSKKKAISELQRNAGTQFDPKIVDIFLEYLKQEP